MPICQHRVLEENMIYLIIILIIIIILILFCISIFFVSERLSPVPFFPTNSADIKKIISVILTYNKKSLNKAKKIKTHIIFIDLGAGSGRVIFTLAKNANNRKITANFYAVEINPILCLYIGIKRFFCPYKKNVHILRADMFSQDFPEKIKKRILHTKPKNLKNKNSQIIIYMYISPWLMPKLEYFIKSLPKGSRLISYYYKAKGLTGLKLVKSYKGINNIYEYKII